MINSFFFKDVQEIDDTLYELKTMKKKLVMKLPIQIGFFVYQYAKLRMLQFYHEFLDHFLDRSDFELLEMDTDSSYLALAAENLESLVKPELQEEFRGVKDSWLPRTGVHAAYDKRTLGLFKVEWEGDGFIGLNSKTYYCWGDTDKVSCKGIQKKKEQDHQGRVPASVGNWTDGRRCQQRVSDAESSYVDLFTVPRGVHLLLPKEESLGGWHQHRPLGHLKKKKKRHVMRTWSLFFFFSSEKRTRNVMENRRRLHREGSEKEKTRDETSKCCACIVFGKHLKERVLYFFFKRLLY